ncbi:MAG: HU family DNA-binding protein [Phycisphaeraceae bacterium]
MAKAAAEKKPPTKTEILDHIAKDTGLTKKEVSGVLDSLEGLMKKNLKPRSAQQFALPGLLKIVVQKRPATKSRQGVNPATGETMTIPAKPARKVVKVRPLKKLKEMI